VNPKAGAVIGNAGIRALSERPALAVLAMETIASYSNVEGFFLRLFIQLCGGNSAAAAKMYLALEADGPKKAALRAAVDSLSNEKHKALLRAVIDLGAVQKKFRDKLAHHIWWISPQVPDALILADPRVDSGDFDNIMVYRETDFKAAIAANDRLCGYGLTLKRILQAQLSASRREQLLGELCSEPEILKRLNLQASQDPG
jgi:hypothetical protein